MDQVKIKPIETRYKGHRFRSRLEARWAVFLDSLGVVWQYEPQGFDLGDGLTYLPDFYLPDFRSYANETNPGWFLEIKPMIEPTDVEKEKARRLSVGVGQWPSCVVIVCGDPFDNHSIWFDQGDIWKERDLHKWPLLEFMTSECDPHLPPFPVPGFGPKNLENLAEFCTAQGECIGAAELRRDALNWRHPNEAAAVAARSARFEHGDRPA